MSFYARQMLNRPGSCGQQFSNIHQSRNVTDDSRNAQRRDPNVGGGGGGIARFSQKKQSFRDNQNRQPGFFRNERFHEDVDEDNDGDDAEQFPIEGSIHAHSQREDRNFSQVTLSQLSDGPSVRSMRSHHSLSRGVIAPASLRDNDNYRSTNTRGNGGVSGRGRLLKHQSGRHFSSTPSKKQTQQLSQSTVFGAADDANSVKSSQTLLSQYHRPSSNGDSKSGPSSSQSGITSLNRTSSRGSDYYSQQVAREDGENNSIRSSQPLLSVVENGAMSQLQPKHSHTPNLKQQQQISQLRTPSCLSNLPSLREHSKRYSSGSTTIRTIGAISGTLSSFPTPSQALRSIRSAAIRTSSSLVALTPFRKGRFQNTIGSSVGTPLLSSIRRSTTFTPTRKLGQSSTSAVSNQFPNVAPVHEAPSAEHQNAHDMNSNSVSIPRPISLSVVQPSIAADDNQSNAAKTKNAEPSVGRCTESASTPVLETHACRKDINRMNNDDISKETSVSSHDLNDKTEEILTATRELKYQIEQLEKSKQEFHDMNERAYREIREEYAKLEALQKSMDAKYETLQTSIDNFSSRMTSSAIDHESAIRTLVDSSMNELRQESCNAVVSVSQQIHEQAKAQLPSGIRTLIETETRQQLLETIDGMVDLAKNDFQQWVSGAQTQRIVSGLESDTLNSLAITENLGIVGHTTIQSAEDSGNSAPESMRTDRSVELSRNTVLRNDTADDVCAAVRVRSQALQYDSIDKKKMSCYTFAGDTSHADEKFEEETPMDCTKSIQSASDSSNPGFEVSKDFTSGECIHHNKITLSLTPIPRSSMSTLTTPFSRKATPLKNNFAKNKQPRESSGLISRNELEAETDGGSVFDEFPNPAITSEPSTDSRPKHVDAPTDQGYSLIASSSSGSIMKVKVVIDDSSYIPSPAVKSSTGSALKDSKRKTCDRLPNQALVNITSRTVNNTQDQDVISVAPKKKKIHEKSRVAKPVKKKASRKRDHSGAAEDTPISPRRSKRQREANRVRQIAPQSIVGNHVPSKVTPKEELTPVVQCNYERLAAAGLEVNSVEHRINTSTKDCDSLLGTSVTIPATFHDSQEDNQSGLDDDNMIMDLSHPEKRPRLTSLLPFVNGFGYRSGAAIKPTKTFSKKRSKRKIPAAFDYDEFNFS